MSSGSAIKMNAQLCTTKQYVKKEVMADIVHHMQVREVSTCCTLSSCQIVALARHDAMSFIVAVCRALIMRVYVPQ